MAYCNDSDLVKVFGSINISRWADVDNDGLEFTIEARKEWAREFATNYIDGRLYGGLYTVPFTAPYPQMIVDLTALYAGIVLYDGRSISIRGEEKDQVSRQRRDFERFIKQILRGQMRLLDSSGDQLEVQSKNYPFVADVDSDSDDDDYSAAEISL